VAAAAAVVEAARRAGAAGRGGLARRHWRQGARERLEGGRRQRYPMTAAGAPKGDEAVWSCCRCLHLLRCGHRRTDPRRAAKVFLPFLMVDLLFWIMIVGCPTLIHPAQPHAATSPAAVSVD